MQRVRVGDWEGDLITGRLNQSAIGALVDRTSRYLRLIPLPKGHAAERVRDGLLAAFADVPKAARWTLTWDQGSEMAFHDQVAPLFHEGVSFAYPAGPWQRGTNENTNTLLRQYFPKGADLSLHSAEDLRAVERRLNSRPRKSLGRCTPAEVFASLPAQRQTPALPCWKDEGLRWGGHVRRSRSSTRTVRCGSTGICPTRSGRCRG